MKPFLIIVVIYFGLMYWIDQKNPHSLTKKIFFLETTCAFITGSHALRESAVKQSQKFKEEGVKLTDEDVTSAMEYWARQYDLPNAEALLTDPHFVSTCHYNACINEGNDIELCIKQKADACVYNDIPYHKCFPED